MAKYLESRWRGAAGQAITPSTLALLGERVRRNTLIPFEKMHPSIALLPTAEDAATAFAEVYFAVDWMYREQGSGALRKLMEALRAGKTDRQAVEVATQKSFAGFEKAWLAHVKRQPFPKELIPLSSYEKKQLKTESNGKDATEKGRDISFGDFAEIAEADPRKRAHLGELLRERGRVAAAAEQYGKAYEQVRNRYESLSNKYALALLELKKFDRAEEVLKASLELHPGAAATQVHLGRIYLRSKNWTAARSSYLGALATDPFDPEIHVALFRAHTALGETAFAERAQKNASLLTGIDASAVAQLAQTLTRDDLADVKVPPTR
jgi:predicted Zn-dependent protease